MKREEIFQYVKEQYGTEPEYLWKKDPDSAVLRHKNGKWYAIIMAVEKKTLGLEEDGKINILDVKCDPDLVGMLIQTYGFLPGYHMNKRHWITILLDESVSEAKTLDFLDMSYDLIDSGKETFQKKSLIGSQVFILDMYKLIVATGYFPNLVHGAALGEYESLLFLPL